MRKEATMQFLLEWNPGDGVLEADQFVERYGRLFEERTFETSQPFHGGMSSRVRCLAVTWLRTEVSDQDEAEMVANGVSSVLGVSVRAIRYTLDGQPFNPA